MRFKTLNESDGRMNFKDYLNENITNKDFIDELTTFIESWINEPFHLEKKFDNKGYPIKYTIYDTRTLKELKSQIDGIIKIGKKYKYNVEKIVIDPYLTLKFKGIKKYYQDSSEFTVKIDAS